MTTIYRSLVVIVFCLSFVSIVKAQDGHDEPAITANLTFKQYLLHIQASIQNKPVVGQETVIVLEAKNPDTHENVEIVETVDVSLWMPDMGHGSSPTTVEKALDEKGETIPGVYIVREVYFTMGGQWEVNVTLTNAEGQTETQAFKVQLKGGHHH